MTTELDYTRFIEISANGQFQRNNAGTKISMNRMNMDI
jgi:hypothetical protein